MPGPSDAYATLPPPPDLRAAMAAVRGLDPRFAALPDAPVYRWAPGLPALARVVVGQLVSTRAADTVHARLAAQVPLTAAALAACPEDVFRAAGLNRAKSACLRGLGAALAGGAFDLDGLAALDDWAAIAALTALPGIGPWTAEIYLLFALGRLDVLPASDLAIQVGYQRLAGLPARPTPAALRRELAHLAPFRGVAAFLLWDVYRRPILGP